MYTLQDLKKIVEAHDMAFIENFEWEDLHRIIEGWDEELAVLNYNNSVNTDYNATRLK